MTRYEEQNEYVSLRYGDTKEVWAHGKLRGISKRKCTSNRELEKYGVRYDILIIRVGDKYPWDKLREGQILDWGSKNILIGFYTIGEIARNGQIFTTDFMEKRI